METPPIDLVLVEDNKIDADVILRLLQKENPELNCFVLNNGEEAMHFFLRTGSYKNQHPHIPKLVLLDMRLPSFSGIEILDKIRQTSDTPFVPVVMLSSSDRLEDISQSYSKGANAYVVKPVKFEQMKSIVRALVAFWLQTNTLCNF